MFIRAIAVKLLLAGGTVVVSCQQQSVEEWEKQTKQLMNFIRTKAKPHLYYTPKRHHPNSDKRLRETRSVLQGKLTETGAFQ